MTKDIISYEQFSALDIRVGKIKTVEVVEGADRLLKLMVDIGETDAAGEVECRQIVSGIREFFGDPEVLVGGYCTVLINLEPRTIKGVESQGMILAGKDGDGFALLTPAVELSPGSIIS